MEKTKRLTLAKHSPDNRKQAIWDCSSSLYDSFELKSVEKLLDSAVASKSLSMPHLPAAFGRPPPTPKLPRSAFRWLIRAVLKFRLWRTSKRSAMGGEAILGGEQYWSSPNIPTLSAIQEASKFDGLSPEIEALFRRTSSERFTGDHWLITSGESDS